VNSRDDLLLARLDELAEDVGRLRRRLDGSLKHLADRLAAAVEILDAVLYPTASELVAALEWTPTAKDVDAALEVRDARTRSLRRLLAYPTEDR
jgi:hypothetical protein